MNIERFMQRYPKRIFVLLLALTIWFSFQLGSDTPSLRSGLSFIPQAEYVERLSGTFRPAVAFFFYMRGALEIAGDTSKKMDMLLELFSLSLKLDAKIVQAAFLGGVVAPVTDENLLKAVIFLEKACELNPDNWRIPYWTGFSYLELGNISKGAEYYWKASLLAGAPPFLRYSAVALPAEGRTLEQSIIETEGMLESVDNDEAREWVMQRLVWLQSMLLLEHKVKEFKNTVSRYPVTLDELVEKGLIKEIPKDDFGNGFYLVNPGDPDQGFMVRSL